MQPYAVITNSTVTTVEAHHYAKNRNGDFVLFDSEDADQPVGEFPSQHCEGIVLSEFVVGVAR